MLLNGIGKIRFGAVFLTVATIFCSFAGCGNYTTENSMENKGFSSAEEAAKAWIRAAALIDCEGQLDAMPFFMTEVLAERVYCIDDDSRESVIRHMEERYGHEEKPQTFEITKVEINTDEDALESVKFWYEKRYKCKKYVKKIEEAVNIDYSYETENGQNENMICCVKIDGSWYAQPFFRVSSFVD